jgi:hypothetical protein
MSRLGFAIALAAVGAATMMAGDDIGWWAGLALVLLAVVSLIFIKRKGVC